jgi:hypothetical protein
MKYIFAIILITTSMASYSKTSPSQLANCLATKGWVMYEADGCSACANQRSSFGDAFANIKTVVCGDSASEADMKKCAAHNIRYTPTWLLIEKGSVIHRLEGNQPLDELAKVSGCG